ncbi:MULTISPECIES: L-rhamnose mutarotase [Bacillus]|uniref:L-rhamnose mutarotase n=1 Tax=Bacillus TaxID=1386 RepID=UPI000316C5F4|nr:MULTISPECIES: L-rhamnose mutarotase [Bacillus]
MIRKASVMKVYRDQYEEYKRRHDELWPEMADELRKHGSHNYSIFLLEETGQLFAYVEIEDEAKWASMADTDICKKWWAYMEPLMETNPDNSPIATDLKEVFFLK